jgi:hypothetical protein
VAAHVPNNFFGAVARGLDPRVHRFRKKMDRRVKPGDDVERVVLPVIPSRLLYPVAEARQGAIVGRA